MKYTFEIYKNCKLVKFGNIFLKDDIAEETFILKMEQKYRTSDNDLIDVCLR